MRLVLLAAMALWATAAAADLYRWVDPGSGSIKFSSYPPPWHDDPAKARRAPTVEVIPSAGSAAPAASLPADRDRGPTEALEAQRKALLQQIPQLAAQATTPQAAQALARHLDAYKVIANEIDRRDPPGAAARQAEMQSLVQKSLPRGPQ